MNSRHLNRFLIFSLLLAASACNSKEHPQTLQLPEGLELINQRQGTKEICHSCEKKIVLYHDMTLSSFYFLKMSQELWIDLAEEHPEISVILYSYGENKEKGRTKESIESYLHEISFPYQVYYDKENEFYELNELEKIPYKWKAIQSYMVLDGKVLGRSEFGIPELFAQNINEHFGSN
ncbi:hypothetical protein J0A68_05125 [Algoriphagus sp. H41]|uniref:Thioredoxin-like fold domain-containing protein n=1 Tax=Algoriphagus oliviformis TaxID=2811231 RepID=A0ABS3BZQ3_9BACT|nr:hypothetical protein [Algoriphagus oliviformis]MBN7810328.1 hypothetical protein [Algoriphagus oliviformis]